MSTSQRQCEMVDLWSRESRSLTWAPQIVRTVSLLGARISSIIMLSRVNELRFSVLDLSELKERRLGVGEVTDYQDNSNN